MSGALERYFEDPQHMAERATLPLLRELIRRYSGDQPLKDQTIIFGHVLSRNSMVMVEALVQAGAQVILTDAQASPAEAPVRQALSQLKVRVFTVEEGVAMGDVYLDVAAVLGQARPPRLAAEVTRSGTDYYQELQVPVINADISRSKLIEGFFGTGEAFLRAWHKLRPHSPLAGKHLVLVGYGKIGRGVAFRTREVNLRVTVIDRDPTAVTQASHDGFESMGLSLEPQIEGVLREADIIVAVTGKKGAVGHSLPKDWLLRGATLVNLGAEDEFGPGIRDDQVLGGKSFPLNFHLEQPTLNRYVDAPLAAHLLALESLILSPEQFGPGVHPLPQEHDQWVIERWRHHHPDEDLKGIQQELGL